MPLAANKGADGQAAETENGSAITEASDSALSSTLIRGLEILGSFSETEEQLSNSEIADRLGLNRATVSRLCKTLLSMGYLRRDAKGKFRLAPRILSLSYPLLATTVWRHQVIGPMREVADLSQGNVTIAAMSGDVFVQLLAVGDPAPFPYSTEPGKTGPLYKSASGRALLALLDDETVDAILADLRSKYPAEFDAHAERTTDGIARCRAEGFCTSYREWRPTIFSASAPLGVTDDGLLLALTCGLPSYRARDNVFETDIGPRLAQATEAIRMTGLFKPPFYLSV